MKLSLIVQTAGRFEGKEIPINLAQFVIGRDPSCHLRPASALVSKRHCALLVRGQQVFLRDFDSTNGTFLNDQPVKTEVELHDSDQLRVGPVAFRIHLEVTPAPVNKPTPLPPAKTSAEATDDEAAAALLLSLQDENDQSSSSAAVDKDGIPTGSTVMETLASPPAAETAKEEAGKAADPKSKPSKTAEGDTSTAAKAILDKYLRRPRT